MPEKNILQVALVAISVSVVLSGPAEAASDAEKCMAGKNKVSGKYYFCREKAQAKAILTGDPPDFTSCGDKFTAKWDLLENKVPGACPDNVTTAQMNTYLANQAAEAAAIIAGTQDVPTCGDNQLNLPGEQCDGTDLGGESCTSLGFVSGSLGCSSCSFDTSACQGDGVPETGQTQCDQGGGTLGACPGSPAGQDGASMPGIPRSFVDNGDGTITDQVTGLMWEKLSDDGSIHDKDIGYSWSNAFALKIGPLNSMMFAGYNDWRLPTVTELQTLVNYGAQNPSAHPALNTGCNIPGCTVLTCSCTNLSYYWTSTSYLNLPTSAWAVGFDSGKVQDVSKGLSGYVRAVRTP